MGVQTKVCRDVSCNRENEMNERGVRERGPYFYQIKTTFLCVMVQQREREGGEIRAFVVAIEVSAFGKQEIDNTFEDGELQS